MAVFDLKNNALFLRNWRERMRFPTVASGMTIAFLVIFLIFSNCFVHETREYNYATNQSVVIPWLQAVLWYLSVCQGFLVLFFGSLSALRMTSLEKQSGTLDFHRSSPTARRDQVIGLVLGGPILEWCIFMATSGVTAYLVVVTPVNFSDFFIFNARLIVCGIFFHSAAVLFGLISGSRKSRVGVGIALVVSLLCIIFRFAEAPFFYHAFWVSIYEGFSEAVKGYSHGAPNWQYRNIPSDGNAFFGFRLEPILFQGMIQIPLIAFLCTGIRRKISLPERPVLSKDQWIALSFFLFFLYVGCFFPIGLYGLNSNSTGRGFLTYFFNLVLILGILGSLESTPGELLFSKGLRRNRKSKIQSSTRYEDHASNLFWLACFFILAAAVHFLILSPTKLGFFPLVITLVLLLSPVAFFSAAFEFFNLSRHHHKRSLFWTGLGIIWIAIPIFGGILNFDRTNRSGTQYFLIHSPFSSSPFLVDYLTHASTGSSDSLDIPYALGLNLAMVAVMLILSHLERKRIKEIVLAEPA